MGRLSGKVVIVTGAAKGLGNEMAHIFVKEGAKVVATDILEEGLQTAMSSLDKDSVLVLKQNVTLESDWKDIVDATISKFGKIDGLVNNAGILAGVPLEGTQLETYQRIMDVNAKGSLIGILAVAPYMKENGGSIINISSTGGLIGNHGDTAYGMSKAATRLLAKDAACELGKYGIQVNSIHPGPMATEMLKGYFEAFPEAEKQALERIPLGRFGHPSDIAYTAVFLLSGENKFITGTEIVVDGGRTVKF